MMKRKGGSLNNEVYTRFSEACFHAEEFKFSEVYLKESYTPKCVLTTAVTLQNPSKRYVSPPPPLESISDAALPYHRRRNQSRRSLLNNPNEEKDGTFHPSLGNDGRDAVVR